MARLQMNQLHGNIVRQTGSFTARKCPSQSHWKTPNTSVNTTIYQPDLVWQGHYSTSFRSTISRFWTRFATAQHLPCLAYLGVDPDMQIHLEIGCPIEASRFKSLFVNSDAPNNPSKISIPVAKGE